ncbi:MAG: methionyl-tRNA formyltransferase [Flavobacteriia bacterium]|nr:methionyl-tRNA formyltransferase [Flavobacteriia bacterium]
MRLGVAATPDVAIPTLDWLLATDHEIALVITQPDRPSGRGRVVKQSVVGEWAQNHKISVVKPESSHELSNHLKDLDCVITIGYGVLLPQEILDIPKFGFLNLHFSLLPAYRGAAPVQRALLHGEETTGVTVFQLEKGMDTGPIYSQITIPIDPNWRSFELFQRLAQEGPAAINEALLMIQKGVLPTPQSGQSTLAGKITKEEARIDFAQSSEQVVNHIRAFTYEPGAWTLWNDESFKITSAIVNEEQKLTVGQIRVLDNRLYVGCGHDTAIELLNVVPAGKREMPAVDWARGARLLGGEKLG